MEVNMEYLNVYDNNKNKLDKKIVRGDKLSNDEHILVAVIFIKNKDNKNWGHVMAIEPIDEHDYEIKKEVEGCNSINTYFYWIDVYVS